MDTILKEVMDAASPPLELLSTPVLQQGEVPFNHPIKPKKKDSSFRSGSDITSIVKSNNPPEEKLRLVCSKYSEVLQASRKLLMAYKMSQGKISKLQQENELCQQQRSKAVLQRSRLENLCRELQKLNKAQKEEIDLKLRLEEEKRKEISATFQNAFAEMSTLTSQNTEKNTKMREENLEMREKIKSVRERIELSEQQLEKVREQAQLELQLAEAKMAAVKMEMTAEKECLLKEKQQLLLKLTEYQMKISELQATEVGLRSQINMYTEKYDDFQNALAKSNEVFNGFNEEMEKMSKKIAKLEKETSLWKQRWEKSHVALLEMAADKQTRDAEMEKLNQKLSLLQELCKAFQRERTELLAQLRATKNPSNPEPVKPTESVELDRPDDELPEDCQKLKNDLDQLQQSLDEEKSRIKSTIDETDTTNTTAEISTGDNELCTDNNGKNVPSGIDCSTKNSETQEIQSQQIAEQSTELIPVTESIVNNDNDEPVNSGQTCETVVIDENQQCEASPDAVEGKNEVNIEINTESNHENSIKNEANTSALQKDENTASMNNLSAEPSANLNIEVKEREEEVSVKKTSQNSTDTENVNNTIDTECVTELTGSEVNHVIIENNKVTGDMNNSPNSDQEKVESSTKQNNVSSTKKGKNGRKK